VSTRIEAICDHAVELSMDFHSPWRDAGNAAAFIIGTIAKRETIVGLRLAGVAMIVILRGVSGTI